MNEKYSKDIESDQIKYQIFLTIYLLEGSYADNLLVFDIKQPLLISSNSI